jgi:hypothetical protein
LALAVDDAFCEVTPQLPATFHEFLAVHNPPPLSRWSREFIAP